MTSEKFDHIEETLAHQDKQILDLSEMVTRQWDEIEILKKRLDKTLDKLNDLGSSAGDNGDNRTAIEMAADDKPPHY